MNDKLNIGGNSHIPSYVGVYNSLYSDIKNGIYVENEFLPSEISLAEKYGVSRNTLRQALAILSEDGLILKSQGKGTIVTKAIEGDFIKKISNPMTSFSTVEVDNIEFHYNFNPPTDIAREKLNLEKSEVVLASNNIYSSKNQKIGFSFVQIPVKIFEHLKIDASNSKDIKELINEKIFEITETQHINIKLINATETETEFLQIEEGKLMLLIEAIHYNINMIPLARCKFYFIPEFYKLRFVL